MNIVLLLRMNSLQERFAQVLLVLLKIDIQNLLLDSDSGLVVMT